MTDPYEIWMEGYLATGMEGIPAPAHYVATVDAYCFRDACVAHFGKDPNFSPKNLSYWGCRLFDNEADARRSFG